MISIGFILTEKCDWTCEYCRFKLLENQRDTTIEILDKHLPYIKDLVSKIPYAGFHMQGGEIGMLERETLVHFLNVMQNKFLLSTNGVFFDKGYHLDPEINPHLRWIEWHICEAPGDFKMEKDYNYNDGQLSITKGIVHHSIGDIVAFAKRNPHLEIGFVEYETDITENRTLHREAFRELYGAIKGIKNITDRAKERIRQRIDEDENMRDNCRNLHSSVMINLVDETICLCQRNISNTIELSKENLIRRMQNFPRDIFSGDQMGCDSCVRLYFDKMSNTSISNALKARKIKF